MKENIRIRNNKMSEAISNNNDRVLWDEVKKMTKANNNLPNVIDDTTGIVEISNIFAEKYDTLYNSVSFRQQDLCALTREIATRITNSGTNNTHNITVQDVKKAITK